jgi:hypothetical protein
MSADFVNQRRKQLEEYVRALLLEPALYQSRVLASFLQVCCRAPHHLHTRPHTCNLIAECAIAIAIVDRAPSRMRSQRSRSSAQRWSRG